MRPRSLDGIRCHQVLGSVLAPVIIVLGGHVAGRSSIAGIVGIVTWAGVWNGPWVMECAPLASVDGNALRRISGDAARPERAKVQTDCKRPARYSLPGAVTGRHKARAECAPHGTSCPRLASAVTMLGKLITQRSQVQILSPRPEKLQVRDIEEAPGKSSPGA
jgi:hypothetical protein